MAWLVVTTKASTKSMPGSSFPVLLFSALVTINTKLEINALLQNWITANEHYMYICKHTCTLTHKYHACTYMHGIDKGTGKLFGV